MSRSNRIAQLKPSYQDSICLKSPWKRISFWVEVSPSSSRSVFSENILVMVLSAYTVSRTSIIFFCCWNLRLFSKEKSGDSGKTSHVAKHMKRKQRIMEWQAAIFLEKIIIGICFTCHCLSQFLFSIARANFSGSRSGEIRNHDVRIAQHHVSSFSHHSQEVCGLQWSPTGRYLASGANSNDVVIWDWNQVGQRSGNFVHQFDLHSAAVKVCEFMFSKWVVSVKLLVQGFRNFSLTK